MPSSSPAKPSTATTANKGANKMGGQEQPEDEKSYREKMVAKISGGGTWRAVEVSDQQVEPAAAEVVQPVTTAATKYYPEPAPAVLVPVTVRATTSTTKHPPNKYQPITFDHLLQAQQGTTGTTTSFGQEMNTIGSFVPQNTATAGADTNKAGSSSSSTANTKSAAASTTVPPPAAASSLINTTAAQTSYPATYLANYNPAYYNNYMISQAIMQQHINLGSGSVLGTDNPQVYHPNHFAAAGFNNNSNTGGSFHMPQQHIPLPGAAVATATWLQQGDAATLVTNVNVPWWMQGMTPSNGYGAGGAAQIFNPYGGGGGAVAAATSSAAAPMQQPSASSSSSAAPPGAAGAATGPSSSSSAIVEPHPGLQPESRELLKMKPESSSSSNWPLSAYAELVVENATPTENAASGSAANRLKKDKGSGRKVPQIQFSDFVGQLEQKKSVDKAGGVLVSESVLNEAANKPKKKNFFFLLGNPEGGREQEQDGGNASGAEIDEDNQNLQPDEVVDEKEDSPVPGSPAAVLLDEKEGGGQQEQQHEDLREADEPSQSKEHLVEAVGDNPFLAQSGENAFFLQNDNPSGVLLSGQFDVDEQDNQYQDEDVDNKSKEDFLNFGRELELKKEAEREKKRKLLQQEKFLQEDHLRQQKLEKQLNLNEDNAGASPEQDLLLSPEKDDLFLDQIHNGKSEELFLDETHDQAEQESLGQPVEKAFSNKKNHELQLQGGRETSAEQNVIEENNKGFLSPILSAEEKAKLSEEELQHYLDLEQELEQEVREASAASASSACSSGRDVAPAAAVGCAAGLKPTEGGAALPASSAVPEEENQQQTSAVAAPSAKDKSVEQEGNKNDTSPDMSKYSCTLDWFKEMQERHRQKGVTRAEAVKKKPAGVLPGSLVASSGSSTTKTTGKVSSSAKLIVPAGKAAKLIVPVRKVPPLTQFPVAKVKEVTAFAIKKKPWMNVCPVLPEQGKKGSTAAAGAVEKNQKALKAASSSSLATSSSGLQLPGNKKNEAGKATVASAENVESNKQSARGTRRSSSSRSRSSSRSSSRGRGKRTNASRPRRRRSARDEDHSRSRDRTGRSRRDHSRSPRRRDSRRRRRDSRRRRRGRSRGRDRDSRRRSGRRSRRRRSTSSRRRDRARSPDRRRSRTPTPRSRRERRGGGVTSPSAGAEDELVMQVQEYGGEPIITRTSSSGDKKQEKVKNGAPPSTSAVNYAAFSLPKGGPELTAPGGVHHLDALVQPQEVAAKTEENKAQPSGDQVGVKNNNSINDTAEKRMKRMLRTEEEKQEGRKALLKALENDIMSEENKEEEVEEDGGPHMAGDVQDREEQGISPDQQEENDAMNVNPEGEEKGNSNSNGDLQDVEVEPPQAEDDPFDEEFLQPVADNNPFAMASSCDIFNEDTLFGQKKEDAAPEDNQNEDDSGHLFNQSDPFTAGAPQVEPLHFDLADIYGAEGTSRDVEEPGAIEDESDGEQDMEVADGDHHVVVLEENADLDLAFNTFPPTEEAVQAAEDEEAAAHHVPPDDQGESDGEHVDQDLLRAEVGEDPPALQIDKEADDPRPPATRTGEDIDNALTTTGTARPTSPPPAEQSFSDWLKDYDKQVEQVCPTEKNKVDPKCRSSFSTFTSKKGKVITEFFVDPQKMPQPVKEVADTKTTHIMDMIAQERSRQKKREEEKSRNKGKTVLTMDNLNADGAAGKKKNASAATSSSSKHQLPLDRSKPPPPPAPKAAPPPPRKRTNYFVFNTKPAVDEDTGAHESAEKKTMTGGAAGYSASSSGINKDVVFPPASEKDDDSVGPEDGPDEDEDEILPLDNITEDEEGFTLSELVDSGLEGSKNILQQELEADEPVEEADEDEDADDDADSGSSGDGSEDEDDAEDDDSSASSSESEEEKQYVDDITLANELLQQEMDKFDAEEKQRQEYIQKLFGEDHAKKFTAAGAGSGTASRAPVAATASSSSASSSSKIITGGPAPGALAEDTTFLNIAGSVDPFFSQLEPMDFETAFGEIENEKFKVQMTRTSHNKNQGTAGVAFRDDNNVAGHPSAGLSLSGNNMEAGGASGFMMNPFATEDTVDVNMNDGEDAVLGGLKKNTKNATPEELDGLASDLDLFSDSELDDGHENNGAQLQEDESTGPAAKKRKVVLSAGNDTAEAAATEAAGSASASASASGAQPVLPNKPKPRPIEKKYIHPLAHLKPIRFQLPTNSEPTHLQQLILKKLRHLQPPVNQKEVLGKVRQKEKMLIRKMEEIQKEIAYGSANFDRQKMDQLIDQLSRYQQDEERLKKVEQFVKSKASERTLYKQDLLKFIKNSGTTNGSKKTAPLPSVVAPGAADGPTGANTTPLTEDPFNGLIGTISRKTGEVIGGQNNAFPNLEELWNNRYPTPVFGSRRAQLEKAGLQVTELNFQILDAIHKYGEFVETRNNVIPDQRLLQVLDFWYGSHKTELNKLHPYQRGMRCLKYLKNHTVVGPWLTKAEELWNEAQKYTMFSVARKSPGGIKSNLSQETVKAGKNVRKIAPPVEVKLLVSEGNVVVKKDKNAASVQLEKEKKNFYFNPPPKVGAVTTGGGAGAASSAATSSSAKAVASEETPAVTDKTRHAAGQPSAVKGEADEPPADSCTTVYQPGKAKEQPGPSPDPSSKPPKNKPTIISETALLERQKEEQFFMKHPSQNNLAQERQTFAPERKNIARPHFPGVDQFVFFPPVVEMKAINVLKHKDFLGGCPKVTLPPYEEICDRLLPRMHGFGNLIIDIDEIVEAIDAGVISIRLKPEAVKEAGGLEPSRKKQLIEYKRERGFFDTNDKMPQHPTRRFPVWDALQNFSIPVNEWAYTRHILVTPALEKLAEACCHLRPFNISRARERERLIAAAAGLKDKKFIAVATGPRPGDEKNDTDTTTTNVVRENLQNLRNDILQHENKNSKHPVHAFLENNVKNNKAANNKIVEHQEKSKSSKVPKPNLSFFGYGKIPNHPNPGGGTSSNRIPLGGGGMMPPQDFFVPDHSAPAVSQPTTDYDLFLRSLNDPTRTTWDHETFRPPAPDVVLPAVAQPAPRPPKAGAPKRPPHPNDPCPDIPDVDELVDWKEMSKLSKAERKIARAAAQDAAAGFVLTSAQRKALTKKKIKAEKAAADAKKKAKGKTAAQIEADRERGKAERRANAQAAADLAAADLTRRERKEKRWEENENRRREVLLSSAPPAFAPAGSSAAQQAAPPVKEGKNAKKRRLRAEAAAAVQKNQQPMKKMKMKMKKAKVPAPKPAPPPPPPANPF